MPPQTRRSLDGLLAIGPHQLDAQLQALARYAARTRHALGLLWAVVPGEDPACHAPDSGFPIVAFDDDIAGFTAEEVEWSATADAPAGAVVDWHVAHPTPQPKRPTTHLPVYGWAEDGETAADAILCVGTESLDRQVARLEAFSIAFAIRLRGIYVANSQENLRVLLRDFGAATRGLDAGPILTVGRDGQVEVHE